MKVILIENVPNVGKKYEMKEVKDGYARNFLIPQNLAKPATKQNLEWLESQKDIAEKDAEEDLKKSQELASQLDDMEIPMIMKVGAEGQLFESVTAVKVAEKLKEMGFEVKKSQIHLEEVIKALGEFPVKIKLDHNLEVDVRVVISEEKA